MPSLPPVPDLPPAPDLLPAPDLPPAPLLQTGAEKGKPLTDETIRTGEVSMEDHPDFVETVKKLKERGYELRYDEKKPPHVMFRKIYDKQGNHIDTEKYVSANEGMRYLDLEHEIGHVDQLENNLGGEIAVEKVIRFEPGSGRQNKQLKNGGLLTDRQDAIVEYHVRLQEDDRLVDRKADQELLDKHRKGLVDAKESYLRAVNGGKSLKDIKWVKEYFPDLFDLMNKPR